jgi:hypothetical protein
MENKLQIIETPDYTLAVSEKEIKYGEELIPNEWYINSYRGYDKPFKNHNLDSNGYLKRVFAYQPKNNAPTLDLPLLPEIVVEDDVEKLAKNSLRKQPWDTSLGLPFNEGYKKGFMDGYNSSTKTYSEEDLKKAYNKGFSEGVIKGTCSMVYKHESFEEYIQSLKQPKPKWFVAEYKTEYTEDGLDYQSDELKTTSKNGKTYCVGCYLCD